MLQKGFLKPKEDPKNARALKRSRTLLLAGVVLIVFAVFYMMANLQKESLSITVWLSVMIVGFCLAVVGLWMGFFAQNKNRRRME